MRSRRLGKTGMDVSVLGLGTWQFGGEWGRPFDQAEVAGIVERARDLGLNLIDTAECYGDHLAEEFVGAAIESDRDRWVVATKFGHRFHPERVGRDEWSPSDVREDHWAPKEVVAQLDASLRALRTDHVDVFQMHSGPDHVFFDEDLWTVLGEQVREGKVRALGVSLPASDNIGQVEAATGFGIDVVEVTYNRIDRAAERAVLPRFAELDLGVLAREPLANGFLSGRYRKDARITDPKDWRSQLDEAEVERRLDVVAEVETTELPDGVPMAQWAIGWCLRHPAVSAVIPGAKSIEQLEANIRAAELA